MNRLLNRPIILLKKALPSADTKMMNVKIS